MRRGEGEGEGRGRGREHGGRGEEQGEEVGDLETDRERGLILGDRGGFEPSCCMGGEEEGEGRRRVNNKI